MKKILLINLLCIYLVGCTTLSSIWKELSANPDKILLPVSAEVYQAKIKPLVTVLYTVFEKYMSEEDKKSINEIITKMDSEDPVYLLPILVKLAKPIFEKYLDSTNEPGSEISEDEVAKIPDSLLEPAIYGIDFIKLKYSDCATVQMLHPIVKKLLVNLKIKSIEIKAKRIAR